MRAFRLPSEGKVHLTLIATDAIDWEVRSKPLTGQPASPPGPSNVQ